MRLRRLTRCTVQGHGHRCEAAKSKGSDYERTTEERLALRYERVADEGKTSD